MAAKTTRRTTRRRTVRDELTAPQEDLQQRAAAIVPETESDDDETETPEPTAAAKVQRLSLPLTADGSAVDWDRVRNAEKARGVLGLGTTSSAPGTDEGIFGADMIGLALDMIGSGLVSVARAGGYTVESSEVLRFGEQEKAAIVPRATKVLAKHAPSLGRWEDEITLGTTLAIIMAGKLMTLKKAATVTKFPRAVETPEASPTTTPVPES